MATSIENESGISIHAPVKGATMSFAFDITSQTIISIHAPVKGATKDDDVAFLQLAYFNPRTREGCDPMV